MAAHRMRACPIAPPSSPGPPAGSASPSPRSWPRRATPSRSPPASPKRSSEAAEALRAKGADVEAVAANVGDDQAIRDAGRRPPRALRPPRRAREQRRRRGRRRGGRSPDEVRRPPARGQRARDRALLPRVRSSCCGRRAPSIATRGGERRVDGRQVAAAVPVGLLRRRSRP